MAERKATNKYYPPDWDPSKGSINKFVGQHPLRERARKLHEGILIIRFELPYSVWCLGCNSHVGMGVRFNAEKKRVGNYFSTPIFSFRMKCHLCSNWWEIRTDPKNTAYVVVSGAKQKIETWDEEENGTLKLLDDKEREKINNNAISKLEHKLNDKKKADEAVTVLDQLHEQSDRLWGDVYSNSKLMRKKLREEKKVLKAEADIEARIKNQNSLHIKLVPESERDKLLAKTITFSSSKGSSNDDLNNKLVRPLFSKVGNNSKDIRGKVNDKRAIDELKLIASTNTRLKMDPFVYQKDKSKPDKKENINNFGILSKTVKKEIPDVLPKVISDVPITPNTSLLVDYNDSDSGDE